eukprot:CAMPEP_0194027016 /NCGR_PEP_ID=MMETSP0009_2-20130614/1253_1 /TAXON_ID=210454 /ORGANISM="Grammatophora oceanica, Strain CCMP 410" /LENGTH=255 /DNA_ID=CAMNT_0038665943 /DNA_START=44 /DNA_END=809 /DNA_ORIENTATION=-
MTLVRNYPPRPFVVERCPSAEIDTTSLPKVRYASPERQEVPKKAEKPKLRFNSEVYVMETIHVNDLTDEELDEYWFKREDYRMMKQSYAMTVKLVMHGRQLPPGQTFRGLEYRIPDGARARQMNKLNGITAVLEEQERQRIVGKPDDMLVMRAYKKVGDKCLVAAQKLGLQDQTEIHGEAEEPKEESQAHNRAHNQAHKPAHRPTHKQAGNNKVERSEDYLEVGERDRHIAKWRGKGKDKMIASDTNRRPFVVKK